MNFFRYQITSITAVIFLLFGGMAWLQVDSSISVMGVIEQQGENKTLKTEVGGRIIFNGLIPFGQYRQGDLILQIDDASIQELLQNLQEQYQLLEKQKNILAIKKILLEDNQALQKIRLSPSLNSLDYEQLQDYASDWEIKKRNIEGKLKTLVDQINETQELVRIQSINVENLEKITQQSEDLYQKQIINIDQLENDRSNFIQAQSLLSKYKTQLLQWAQEQKSLKDNFLSSELQESVQLQDELFLLEKEMLKINQSIVSAKDELKKFQLLSPIDGVLNETESLNEGSVVSRDQIIGTIAPTENPQFIIGYLPSNQREKVITGMEVRIGILTLNQNSPIIHHGTVNEISPNIIENESKLLGSEDSFYRISIMSDELEGQGYSSGQPVQIFLTLVEQSILSYLIGPILSLMQTTFIE